jgi:hypothetical protein
MICFCHLCWNSDACRNVLIALRQVHPNVGISRKAMCIMESFVNDLFVCIANEASRIARCIVSLSLSLFPS